MMSKIYFIYVIIVIISFFCCSPYGDQGRHVLIVVERSPGKLEAEIPMYLSPSGDTLTDGMARYYYEDGITVQEEVSYKLGVLDGPRQTYRRDSTLKLKAVWRKGVRHGPSTQFYKNQKIESQFFFCNGRRFGPSYYFFFDGKLKAVNIVDHAEKAVWLVEWDSQGNKVRENGRPFSYNIVVDFDSFSTNKFLQDGDALVLDKEEKTFDLIVSCLEGSVISLKYRLYKDSELLKQSRVPISECTASFAYHFTELGNYQLVIIGDINGDFSDSIKRNDSKTFNFSIVE